MAGASGEAGVRSVAARQGVGVHGLRIHDVRGKLSLEMHVEVPDDLTLAEAHRRANAFESALRNFMRTKYAALHGRVEETKDLSADDEKALAAAIEDFKKTGTF